MNIAKQEFTERKEKLINKRCTQLDGMGPVGTSCITVSASRKQVRFIFNLVWYYVISCRETPTVWQL
jgi:hypothetical protein